MRRKIILILITIIMCKLYAGCDIEYSKSSNEESMFIVVESTAKWNIVYHKDTLVMYAISKSGNVFTALVEPDGTPMLWTKK